MIMIIESCSKEKVKDVAWFAYERNQIAELRSKPFSQSETFSSIQKFYNMLIDQECSDLLLLYEDNEIIGVTGISWIIDDNYLSFIGGVFTDGDHDAIVQHFLKYLENEFEGYNLYINVTKEYKGLNFYVSDQEIELLEEAEMYCLSNFDGNSLSEHVAKLDFNNKGEIYEHLNLIITEDTYWNIERLDENLDKFIVLGHYGEHLDGSMYAQIYQNKSVEIFGINSSSESVLREMLISLAYICNEMNASKLILYSWDSIEISSAKSLGYTKYDSNMCFMKRLVVGN